MNNEYELTESVIYVIFAIFCICSIAYRLIVN
jgi:hypothetical protein